MPYPLDYATRPRSFRFTVEEDDQELRFVWLPTAPWKKWLMLGLVLPFFSVTVFATIVSRQGDLFEYLPLFVVGPAGILVMWIELSRKTIIRCSNDRLTITISTGLWTRQYAWNWHEIASIEDLHPVRLKFNIAADFNVRLKSRQRVRVPVRRLARELQWVIQQIRLRRRAYGKIDATSGNDCA